MKRKFMWFIQNRKMSRDSFLHTDLLLGHSQVVHKDNSNNNIITDVGWFGKRKYILRCFVVLKSWK